MRDLVFGDAGGEKMYYSQEKNEEKKRHEKLCDYSALDALVLS